MARQTLLLVDSDLRSVRMLEVALRKAGYNVSMARHAAEALELIALDAPDLILSDTRLPPPDDTPVPADTPRDGYALCRKLKESERWRAIPFIFLTSSGELEDKIRGLELGVEDYLTKPIYLKELITRVQLVLARKQREGMTATSATASRASFSGDLADMGLVDLLTTIDMGRKTGLLEVHDAQSEGWVTFQDGRLLDAQYGRHRGERAVYRLLLWTAGRFELRFGPRALASRGESRTIEAPTQAVLLEGLRRVDEWHHLKEQLPPLGDPYDVVGDAASGRATSLPPEASGLLDLVDGSRTLLDIVDASHHDDLVSLHALSRLYFEGLIRPRSGAGARRSEDPGVSLLAPARPEPTDPFAALEALEARGSSTPEAPSVEAAPPVAAKTPEALPPPIEGSSEGGGETAVPKTGGDTSQSASPVLAAAASGVQDHGLPPTVSPQNRVTPETGRSEIVTSTAPGDRCREKHQERYVSKNKGKKAKGRPRESVPVSSGGPRGPAAGAAVQRVGAGATSSVAPSARSDAPAAPEKNLRVEGNVIHLPSAAPESATDSTAPESLSESPEPVSSEAPAARESESPDAVAASEAPGALVSEAPPAESGTTSVEAVREAVASLRADRDESARTTVPPEERADAKPESAPARTETASETKPEAKAEMKPEPAAKESPRDDAKATKPDSKKPPSDARAAKSDSAEGRPSKIDIVVPRKDELQRNRKESLSTHLSDEARAFFTEAAYQAAYKPDTFEDLQPEPEHAHEAARGKRMMTLIGGSLFLVLAILGGFALYQNYYGVHETSLNMPGSATTTQPLSPEQSARPPEAPTPPPAPPENTPPTTPESTPPPPAVVPAAVDDAGTTVTPPPQTPTPPEATPPATATTTADASTATTPPPAPPPTEPAPVPPPAANPTGQTPAQLLAAVRAYHGPYAGLMSAYNAYFDAAPNDWQTMNSLAERIAEAHPADAESVARRAVTANPTNARGWFLLAFTRKVQGNRAGFREAHGRCIALGGQWAAECRALE